MSIRDTAPAFKQASFDRLARPYRWLEYLCFGRALERCRFSFFPELRGARRVLLYGDGDGRFLNQLLLRCPLLEVDAVDSSAAMLRAAEARLPAGSRPRVRFHHADAHTFTPPAAPYDLVITHFFLDCFTQDELRALIGRIPPHLAPDARWLVSEFAIPEGRFTAPVGRLIVTLLYFAFGLLTGLRVTRLPDYPAVLDANGFALLRSKALLRGLLRSELWSQSIPSERGNTVSLTTLPTCMQTNPGPRFPDAFDAFNLLRAGGFPAPDVIPNPGPNPSPDPEPDTPGFPEPDPDPDPLDPLPMPSPVTVQ